MFLFTVDATSPTAQATPTISLKHNQRQSLDCLSPRFISDSVCFCLDIIGFLFSIWTTIDVFRSTKALVTYT